MDVGLTKTYIKSLLGDIIYYRAVKYYEQGKVLGLYPEDDGLYADVQGSGGHVYEVFIGDDEVYDCNCPYGNLCKHIGAVLLEMEDQQVYNSVNPIDEFLNYNTPDENSVEEFSYNSFIDTQWKEFSESSQSSDKFDISFNIVCSSREKPVIKAVLRYIKKDGSWGRTEDISFSKSINNLDENIETLLEYFNGANSFTQPLALVLPLFIEMKQDLYYQNQVVTYGEFNRVTVDFVYNKVGEGREHFPAQLNLYNSDTMISENLYLRDVVLDLGHIYAFDRDKSSIFIKENRDIINLFILKASSFPYIFYGDARRLMERYNSPGLLDFNFPVIGRRFSYVKPLPVLRCHDWYSKVYIDVGFYYGDEFIDIRSSDSRLKPQLNGEYVECYSRDFNYEELFSQFLVKTVPGIRNAEVWQDFLLVCSDHMDYFIRDYFDVLDSAGVVIEHKKKRIRVNSSHIAYSVENRRDWFDLQLRLVDENGKVEKMDIDEFSKTIIKTPNGYTRVDRDSLDRLNKLKLSGESFNSFLRIDKRDFSSVDLIYDRIVGERVPELEVQRDIAKKLKGFSGIDHVEPPEDFKGTLRDYQQAGFNWLHFLHSYRINGCLADDMGLGKTIQTLALLQSLKEDLYKTSIMVVPVVTMGNWELECRKFTPELELYRYEGPKRVKDVSFLKEFDIVLVSYQTLVRDIDVFSNNKWFYLILDEAQYIKNPKTKAHKTICTIDCEHRLSLTGTPVENSSMDLFAQMNFLNPGLLGDVKTFRSTFANPIEKHGDSDVEENLGRMVKPFILRRKKEDVLDDLPEKEVIVQYCEMGKKQRKLYNTYREIVREQVAGVIEERGVERSTISILDALLKLRQISLFPDLVDENYTVLDSCKMDSLKVMLEDIIADGHKVLIFSQFVKTLERVEFWLNESDISYSKITGSTKNRSEEIDAFEKRSVFLLSLKAGGVGINLTSADYVILLDPWWNPAVESQAIDRCHRIGQKNRVLAYKMIVRDTVEEKILDLQQSKSELAKGLVSSEASIFKTLGRDDVLALFD